MYPFKNRSLDTLSKVDVYRNLHDKTGNKKYSIRQNGLVVGHTNLIYLNDVKFVVNQKGRERVIREKRKNVHAFLRGFITNKHNRVSKRITYNPYKSNSFVNHFGQPVQQARSATMNPQGVWVPYETVVS